MNIVPTNITYTYPLLQENIQTFKRNYPFIETGNIGYSVLGKTIYYIRLGNGPKEVFYNAAFHANEWITTPLLMKFAENYCNAYENYTDLQGYSIRELFSTTSLYLVPMVNPDGVELVTGTLTNSNALTFAQSIASQYPDIPFPSGWKANIEGVDLKNYQPFCKVL